MKKFIKQLKAFYTNGPESQSLLYDIVKEQKIM